MADRVCSHSAVNLGKAMFPLFALALNQTENFFDDKASMHSNAPSFAK
jgi:hypothetical protein